MTSSDTSPHAGVGPRATNSAAYDLLLKRHVLWAVHYAHQLAVEDPAAAARLVRSELNWVLRGWSQ